MESERIGFFAVPSDYSPDLCRLGERCLESLKHARDDYKIRSNDIYCFAASVAEQRRTLSGGKTKTAFAVVLGFLSHTLRYQDKSMFCSQETRAIAQGMSELERTLGGEDEVLRGALDRVPGESCEALRSVYRACKEILQAAEQHGLGFAWAILDANAETELEAKQQQQRALAEEAARDAPVDSEEERARARAFLDELIEEGHFRYHIEPTYLPLRQVWLALVPDADIPAIRERLARAEAVREDPYRFLPLLARVHELVRARAQEQVMPESEEEIAVLASMEHRLELIGHGVRQPGDVYTAAEAEAYRELLCGWSARYGGDQGLIEELADDNRVTTAAAERAYHAFAHALARAIEQGLGFVIMREYELVPESYSY